MKKVITPLETGKGSKVSFGYGVAYMNWHTYTAVYYPIPLNWVVGIARKIWFHLMRGIGEKSLANAEQKGYERGHRVGRDRGWRDGYEYGLKEGWDNRGADMLKRLDEHFKT